MFITGKPQLVWIRPRLVVLQYVQEPVSEVDGVGINSRGVSIPVAELRPRHGPDVSPPPRVRVPTYQRASAVSEPESVAALGVIRACQSEACSEELFV